MANDLLEDLEQTRDGYEEEAELHRLLLDAYGGGGGFSGSVHQPTSSYWGVSASIYTSIDMTDPDPAANTYLDKFQRESDAKFIRRIASAHYSNYIKPLTDLKLSYILRKDFGVENRPDKLIEWREDIDGRGTSWDHVRPIVALRAATLGWCPVVIDMPPAPVNTDGSPVAITRQTANDLGLRPAAIPLFPANLVDYQTDDNGAFTWAKVRTDHMEQATPFEPRMNVTRYTVWYPDRYETFEVKEDGDRGQRYARVTGFGPHNFGRVPIEVLKHTPAPDDPIKGIPMHGQESIEARAHFNRQSELDEHLRSQVFAVLVMAAEANEDGGKVKIGVDNGLYLDPESKQKHYYMSPDAGVADTYETRLESGIEEIYRQARVQFARPTAARQAVSGTARKFEFAQTDRALADYALQISRFDEGVDELVGRGLGLAEDVLETISVTPPESFDVDDQGTDMELAVAAIEDLKVGPTATRLLRERLAKSLLHNISDDEEKLIENDLVQLEKDEAQEKALMAEAAAAGLEDDEDDDGNIPGDGDGTAKPSTSDTGAPNLR